MVGTEEAIQPCFMLRAGEVVDLSDPQQESTRPAAPGAVAG